MIAETVLGWVFVTPNLHHIHHHWRQPGTNCNYGDVFSIWDRLFGTYVDPEELKSPITFGIGERVPLARLVAGV